MELPDVEKLVGELEVNVDRLRSLYEQYFMGIEKLEPTVPRKDVDRRIHVLRKEQIRNTAVRFRFQMILQRYNTYQTHWQRILREIEGGTYKRHVVRAQQRFEGRRSTRPPPPPAPAEAPVPAGPAGTKAAPPPRIAPPPAPLGFPQPGAALPQHLAAELADLDGDFGPAQAAAPAVKGGPPVAGPRPPPLATTPAAAPGKGPPPPPPAPRPAQAAPAQPRPAEPGPARPGAPPPPARPAPPPRPAAPAAPAPAPRPAAAPAAAAPPPAPRAAAPAAPAARPGDASLSDERVRTLYAQFVDAKRKQNESTAAITYEGVAKSLRDSSAKLREKHGKNVDFEVTVKDGKTILKPVLR